MQAVSADQQQRIAGALVEILTDKDTGVGYDAAAALQQYGSTQRGQLHRQCIPYLAPLPCVSQKSFPPSVLSHRLSQAVVLHAEVQDSRTWCPHKVLGSS
jgi:hypothetical protein